MDDKGLLIKGIKDFFSSYEGVLCIYLFGSTIKGRGWKREKDIDIGVLFSCEVKAEEGERIGEELTKILQEKVDVIILNLAPPLLRYEVIKEGEMMFCRDEEGRVEFETRSLLKFYDLEPLRKQMVSETKRLIREGKF